MRSLLSLVLGRVATDPRTLAEADRAVVTAPAGYGKTHLIAEAVAQHCSGRQLLLTHTHAGVRAMREKLRSLGCPPGRAEVETIDGWSLRYATAYPGLARLPCPQPRDSKEWQQLREGVAGLLRTRTISTVVANSYDGLIVDEYQDCSADQHRVVLALAENLPTRVLGDPMQAIFDFAGQPVVRWENDVLPNFQELEHLDQPRRWQGRNEELGAWLAEVRKRLKGGEPIDLNQLPRGTSWRPNDRDSQRAICYQLSDRPSVVALFAGAETHRCHQLSQTLGGRFQGMEPFDSKDLYDAAEAIEQSQEADRVLALVSFCARCRTALGGELGTIVERITKHPGEGPGRIVRNLDQFHALEEIVKGDLKVSLLPALNSVGALSGSTLHRRELWEAMRRAAGLYGQGGYATLFEAAWAARQEDRNRGRPKETRAISRTVLAKGLEYSHGIVLDASTLDRKQLYVALTRASDTLTILARDPILRPE